MDMVKCFIPDVFEKKAFFNFFAFVSVLFGFSFLWYACVKDRRMIEDSRVFGFHMYENAGSCEF